MGVVRTASKSVITNDKAIAKGKPNSRVNKLYTVRRVSANSHVTRPIRTGNIYGRSVLNLEVAQHEEELTMAFGTLTVGLGISSHKWAPQSAPKKPYREFMMHRMKAKPSFDQPVEFVVFKKTYFALAKFGAAQERIVITVTHNVVREKYTEA